MTTHSIRSDNVSPVECAPSSQTRDPIRVYGSDGSDRLFTRAPASETANGEPCKVFHIDAGHASSILGESFSDFDKLLKSIEEDPQATAALQDGRKWVAEAFYGDRSTLASLRLAAGLSQRQVADACGIEQPHVSRYESGKHEPSISTAKRIATVLGVGLDAYYAAWESTRDEVSTELEK